MGATGEQTADGGTGDLTGPRFSEEDLVRTAAAVLGALGAPQQTAQLVATSLALSNLVGHDSHGIVRLIQYSDWVRTGQIQPGGAPTVVPLAARWPPSTAGGGSVSRRRRRLPGSPSSWPPTRASPPSPSVRATTSAAWEST